MKTQNDNTAQKTSSKKGEAYAIEESKLMELFEDELKDIYWAEKH